MSSNLADMLGDRETLAALALVWRLEELVKTRPRTHEEAVEMRGLAGRLCVWAEGVQRGDGLGSLALPWSEVDALSLRLRE